MTRRYCRKIDRTASGVLAWHPMATRGAWNSADIQSEAAHIERESAPLIGWGDYRYIYHVTWKDGYTSLFAVTGDVSHEEHAP